MCVLRTAAGYIIRTEQTEQRDCEQLILIKELYYKNKKTHFRMISAICIKLPQKKAPSCIRFEIGRGIFKTYNFRAICFWCETTEKEVKCYLSWPV
jgi:hypothetical protein